MEKGILAPDDQENGLIKTRMTISLLSYFASVAAEFLEKPLTVSKPADVSGKA